MNVFDRLQQKLEVEKREEGISPVELAELPPNLRKIMRLMLREVEIFYTDLVKAISEMPANDQVTGAALDDALSTLTRQGWLIRRGEGERVNYQVNLKRKQGSKMAQGVYNTLDEKITKAKDSEPKEPPPANG